MSIVCSAGEPFHKSSIYNIQLIMRENFQLEICIIFFKNTIRKINAQVFIKGIFIRPSLNVVYFSKLDLVDTSKLKIPSIFPNNKEKQKQAKKKLGIC